MVTESIDTPTETFILVSGATISSMAKAPTCFPMGSSSWAGSTREILSMAYTTTRMETHMWGSSETIKNMGSERCSTNKIRRLTKDNGAMEKKMELDNYRALR